MATQLNLLSQDITVGSMTVVNQLSGSLIGDGSSLTNVQTTVPVRSVKAYLFDDNTVNNSLTFASKSVFPVTAALAVNNTGYESSASGIVVPENGYYVAAVLAKYSTIIQRAAVQVAFTINGTVQAEIGSSGYIRSSSGHNESSDHLTTIYNLVAGDEVGLAFRRDPEGLEGITGLVTLEGTNSYVFLYKV